MLCYLLKKLIARYIAVDYHKHILYIHIHNTTVLEGIWHKRIGINKPYVQTHYNLLMSLLCRLLLSCDIYVSYLSRLKLSLMCCIGITTYYYR